MKKIFTLIFVLCAFNVLVKAQVLTYFSTANALIGQNAFLDGSTNFDPSVTTNNFGKGLIYPRTDLTQWSFVTTMLDGVFLPTYFDGMIVFNTGTGATPITGNNPTTSTNVIPGFYYFSNPGPVTDYKTGQWKTLSSSGGTNTLLGSSNKLTSTVNGVTATLTPAAGTITNTIGFDATGVLVKQTTASLPVTNTIANPVNTITSTVNGIVSTTSAVNTNTLTAATSALTSTVNGVAATLTPAVGTIAQSLGFDATGNLVKGSSVSTNIYTADGTLTGARTVTQNNLDLTFATGTGKTIVSGSFKTTGALYGKPVRDAGASITWAANDVLVKLTSGAGNIDLPSASANPGRIVGINNRSGGPRALNNTSGGDTGIYNEGWGAFNSTVGMVCVISDGTSWSLYSGRP